jgi:hypothetical protein
MKYITVAVAVAAATCPVSASAEPELGIELKGGPNAATLAEPHRFNRYGFSGGLAGHVQWPLVDRLYLAGQVELLYTPRGSEAILDNEPLGKSRQHYLDLMVAARPEARLGPGSVYLLLGGGLNVLLSANKENAAGVKQDITGDLHRLDVALLVGVGGALRLPRRDLGPFRLSMVFFEARHDVGLIDSDAVNGGYKNRTSSLMLGISFVVGPPSPPAITAAR